MTMTEIAAGYISRKQLARELGERLRGKPFSEYTLMGWEREGRGPPATKVGREVVYSVASFEKWLRNQERTKSSAA
jgi:hypothetical protein